ncbi:Tetratricopeptide TPR_1 repeat-containing protein [Granulicella tundricola MP5ACTX9]|uniref:Tetratricopeptide TPR_1 repeat-containing protein n=1 Tax=Granulicella tundricola (strain ATCC BAA-1859 / DSM 23138 / MP5ACTX9) TaxID=1198114 RepID=E8WY35_GRATM|nr:Tetratricopeptide TPR_1 repeat-containing protein [Granulicella tundricola MP5ACTX9]
MTRYTRQDVLRILHLKTRQLTAWERAGLIASHPENERAYSFEHLSQLRALREMRTGGARRVSAKSMLASMEAMQKVVGMRNVLTETSAVRHGSRLAFRHGGALVDPMTQQLAFDFEGMQGQLKVVNAAPVAGSAAYRAKASAEVQEMFLRGVQLEENAATVNEAMRVYESLLELKPDHAPACINLGTIFYNRKDFDGAERMYRRATEADSQYALAFFDLGNVLDEMLRLDEAIEAYGRAIELVPSYADAHYNLALAYERSGEKRRALRHWMAYVRLDPVGPWGTHAKGQARKILSMERLSIVSRGGRKVAAAG